MASKTKKYNEELLEMVFSLSRTLKKEFHPVSSSKSDLSMIQIHALREISFATMCTMTDIARQMHIALPTATVLMNKLVKLGLVKRNNKKDDKRITCLKLTEVGKELVDTATKEKLSHASKILDRLSEQDKKDLLRILTNLQNSLQK